MRDLAPLIPLSRLPTIRVLRVRHNKASVSAWRHNSRRAMASSVSMHECAPSPAGVSPMELNTGMRCSYRGRVCPRWRRRHEISDRPIGAATNKPNHPLRLDSPEEGGTPFAFVSQTKDGIAVWSRVGDDPSCQVKEICAEAIFEGVSMKQFWRALGDVERYAEFVPFVKKSFVLKRELGVTPRSHTTGGTTRHYGENTQHTIDHVDSKTQTEQVDFVWAYNLVKPPAVSRRDFCIKITTPSFVDFATAKEVTSSWEIDVLQAPAVDPNIVRVVTNRGSWTVQTLHREEHLREEHLREGHLREEPNSVKVTYTLLTDPGASLPSWVINTANKNAVPDVLRAFHARAVSGIYDDDDDDDDEEGDGGKWSESLWAGIKKQTKAVRLSAVDFSSKPK